MDLGISKLVDSGWSTVKQERVGNRPRRSLLERQDRKTSGYLDDIGTSVDIKAAMKSGSDDRVSSTRNGYFNVDSMVSEPCDKRIPPMDDSKAQNDTHEGKVQSAERYGYMSLRNLWGNAQRCTLFMSSALEPGEIPSSAYSCHPPVGRLATDKPMGKVARKGGFNPKTSSSATSPRTTPASTPLASPSSKKTRVEVDVPEWIAARRKCTGLANIYQRSYIKKTPAYQVVKACVPPIHTESCVPPIPTPPEPCAPPIPTATQPHEAAMEMAKKFKLLHIDPPMAESKHVERGAIPDQRKDCVESKNEEAGLVKSNPEEFDLEGRRAVPDGADRVESAPDEASLIEKSSSESDRMSQYVPDESCIVKSSPSETSGPLVGSKLDEYDAFIHDKALTIRATVSAEDIQQKTQSEAAQTLLTVLDCVENSQVDVKPDDVYLTFDELADSDAGTSDVADDDIIAMSPVHETEYPETVKPISSDAISSNISDITIISKYTNSEFAVVSLSDLESSNYSSESSKADDDNSRKLSDVVIDTQTDIDPEQGFDDSFNEKLIAESTEKVHVWLEAGDKKLSKKEKKKLAKQKNGDKKKRKWWQKLFCCTQPMDD